MPKIFEVESQSKYRIRISSIENIEDVGDDFITADELIELGVTDQCGRTRYFNSKIKTAINQVLASIKPGKKSAIIKDDDLLECLKESYYYLSHWVKNTRRVGNRLFKGTTNKKEQSVPSFKNWRELVYACNQYWCHTYGVDMNISANNSHRTDTINMYRTSITWEDLESWFSDGSCYNDDHVKWYKMMWEDSETIPQIKSSN